MSNPVNPQRREVLTRFASPFNPADPDAAPPEDRAAVLLTLYQEHNKRFLADSNRIWTTAASMIPLSLGAFALLASIAKPSLIQVVALPAIGWLLMTVWLIIAENLRAFQERSMEWLHDIEHAWGLPPTGPRRIQNLLVRGGQIRRMRFTLWGIVTLSAIAGILFWPGGLFNR